MKSLGVIVLGLLATAIPAHAALSESIVLAPGQVFSYTTVAADPFTASAVSMTATVDGPWRLDSIGVSHGPDLFLPGSDVMLFQHTFVLRPSESPDAGVSPQEVNFVDGPVIIHRSYSAYISAGESHATASFDVSSFHVDNVYTEITSPDGWDPEAVSCKVTWSGTYEFDEGVPLDVPEPASLCVLGLGTLTLMTRRRR